jgi:hypothetical protein
LKVGDGEKGFNEGNTRVGASYNYNSAVFDDFRLTEKSSSNET